jgi:hypothetical protein
MKPDDVQKSAFAVGLAGAGFVCMAEGCQRRQQLEQLKVQNEKLAEAMELLRVHVEGRSDAPRARSGVRRGRAKRASRGHERRGRGEWI